MIYYNYFFVAGGHKKYVCMYPFRGEGVDQLAVTPNDVVHGLCEDPAGWLWVLHVSTGKEGWLPANYLREAVSTTHPANTRRSQCWYNAGPASETVGQHCTSIWWMFPICCLDTGNIIDGYVCNKMSDILIKTPEVFELGTS